MSIQLYKMGCITVSPTKMISGSKKNGGECHLKQHPTARIQKAHLRRLIVRRAADLKVPCGSNKKSSGDLLSGRNGLFMSILCTFYEGLHRNGDDFSGFHRNLVIFKSDVKNYQRVIASG